MCSFGNCKLKNQLIIGYCNYCNKDFCVKHRYPELHNCINLDQVHSRTKLAETLMKSKIVSSKIKNI